MPRLRDKARSRRGVILLEVVLALAVLSLAAFVLMPRPRPSISDVELKAEAARAAAMFRDGRANAIKGRSHADVVVDEARRTIEYVGREPVVLRDGVALAWVTSNLCPATHGGRALRFLADGRSCGGVLTLSAGRRSIQLRVDWLTGRVETVAL